MSTIRELEDYIKQQEELIERRELALKLEKIPEFKKLILDEFCTTEAARYVHTSGNPLLSAEDRQDALHTAQAGGHLLRWLSRQVTFGNKAEENIIEAREQIAELRQEGDK